MSNKEFLHSSAVLLLEAGYIRDIIPRMHQDTARVVVRNLGVVQQSVSYALHIFGFPIEELESVMTHELRSRVMSRVIASLNNVVDGRIPIIDHWSSSEPPEESYTKFSSLD